MQMLNPAPRVRSLANLASQAGLSFEGRDAAITAIEYDHRKVGPGALFCALPGANRHGSSYAAEAVALGAVAILTDSAGEPECATLGVPVLVVDSPRSAMAHLAVEFFDRPQERMLTVGVTGTNGKTTTTNLIAAMLRANDLNPLLVGTVGLTLGSEHWPLARTTPEAPDLLAWMAAAVEQGSKSLVMEVSSQGLVLGRVDGLKFDVVLFTGLSQDHLDFHETMEHYFEAKASLFTAERAARGVICLDDEWGHLLADWCSIPFLTYSVDQPADWVANEVAVDSRGQSTYLACGPRELALPISVSIPGTFNIANSLAAVAAADSLGLHLPLACAALPEVTVPGRLERIECGQDFVVLVDYAHTPDAVGRALQVAKAAATGKVIAVLGCGGDRDRGKREPMGAAAAAVADVVLVTDDNPRSEDPALIRSAVLKGAHSEEAEAIEIGNRREAIHTACRMAAPGDWVLILGKGHESGQEVAGVITPFDDRVVAAEAVASVMNS